jgi:acyl-CoA synthetase (NDP forming)
VWVEALADISLRLAPLTSDEAMDMVMALKGARVLSSFRGQPEADVKALCDVLVRIGRMAGDLDGKLAELDINPLLVREKGSGVCAVDALARLAKHRLKPTT